MNGEKCQPARGLLRSGIKKRAANGGLPAMRKSPCLLVYRSSSSCFLSIFPMRFTGSLPRNTIFFGTA